MQPLKTCFRQVRAEDQHQAVEALAEHQFDPQGPFTGVKLPKEGPSQHQKPTRDRSFDQALVMGLQETCTAQA